MSVQPGATIGAYTIDRELGRGAMGVVAPHPAAQAPFHEAKSTHRPAAGFPPAARYTFAPGREHPAPGTIRAIGAVG